MEFNDCCSFSQYRHTPADLTLSWEQRICADIFGEPSEELLPQCVCYFQKIRRNKMQAVGHFAVKHLGMGINCRCKVLRC